MLEPSPLPKVACEFLFSGEPVIDILTIAQQQVFEPGIVAKTIDLIAGLVANGTISEARIDASYQRILALKAAA